MRRDIVQKRGLLPLPTHQPPLTPLRRPTLPTAQGLAQAEKPNPACNRPPHQRPLSSPPRRMARSADLGLSSPEAVAATSLSHSGPSAAMSPRTSSAASPKFTRWQQAAFSASQRSHIETLLQGQIVPTTMNFCTSAMYHVQRPHLCAGHGQRHRPIKVGMAMRQLKLRGSAGPSYRRPDTIHATWARARPAWPAPGRWLGQRTRSTGCRAASLGQPEEPERA